MSGTTHIVAVRRQMVKKRRKIANIPGNIAAIFVLQSGNVSKCGAGEGRRRSVELIVRKTNKYYIQPRRKIVSYIK